MIAYSPSHLTDRSLEDHFAALVARDRSTTAEILADLAEIDSRKLFLPAAYPSLFAYCVGKHGMSEDAAAKRIHAARAARQFPAILNAVAEGRLHLSGVCLLAAHLTLENADDLLAAAAHKTKSEIEQLLADRFPRTESLTWLQPITSSVPSAAACEEPSQGIASSTDQHAPGHVEARATPAKVAPIAPERYDLTVTIGKSTHDKLRYAQDLLGHRVRSGDVAEVLDRALGLLVRHLEKRKFAATDRPRCGRRRPTTNPRYIPAEVKRAVRERDGCQCTFVSDSGHRCQARKSLELDHIEPVARGGLATVDGVRLRCRAHNQYAAEQVFGVEFMRHKRQEAQKRARAARAEAVEDPAAEVIPWLRSLGFRADEARQAAEACERMPGASLEERVKVALSHLAPRTIAISRAAPA